MQLSSSAADVTDVSSRELSCKSGSSGVEGLLCAGHLAGPSRGRLGRQEACPEAVLGARRPVLSAQEEAVFGARSPRRPVWRPSWAPGGPSRAPGAPCRGRLGARPVLSARLERQEDPLSRAPAGPSGGRLGRQEAENVGFADSSSENVGFADSSSENVGFADSSSENVGFA